MTGADVHTILCSVASLEDFEAGVITDTAILADDRPWICASRLRRLTVAVVLLDPKQSQDLILGRLARLENLRSLNLDMRYLPFYTHQLPDIPPAQAWEKISLQWTLDQGLDQLKHLRRLERLTGPRYQWIVTPLWDQTEARWALEHWVSLKELEGIRLDDEAHKILRPHIRACVEEPHVLV
ncbi:hypothetical protein BGZ83_003225 [Gryganskiella cystojenkinii]|nr:hypothetical protein BGZ83_003225 [Gryganskiella cystojenkinii]